MSLDSYLETKRRNRVRKELRKKYPSLMGQKLEDQVDRHLGIADSGKMDWAILKDNKTTSDHPTPDSVTYDEIVSVAEEYKIRPYVLYWFYMKKVNKIKASGRDKSDYLALIKDIAPSVIGKELDFDTKIVAATMYVKDMKGVTITYPQAEGMVLRGEI